MSNRFQNFVFLIAALMLIATALHLTKNIMIPFILSVFIVYAIQPLISGLEKYLKVKRQFAITFLIVIAVALSFVFIVGIGSSIRQIVQNSQQYEQRVVALFAVALEFLEKYDLPIAMPENLQSVIKEIPVFRFISKASQSIVKSVSDFTLIAIFCLFLLSGKPFELPRKGILEKVNRNIRSYLVTKIFTSTATGFLTGLFLVILDLDMAIMFGFLAFFLNFIPTIGSIIATLLPIPIAVLQFTNPWFVVLTIAVPGLIQLSIGNIIEPKLMGQNLDLHPVTILLSLMFWGFLWGISGMLLATPITVIVKLFLSTSKNYYIYSELMAGRVKFLSNTADNLNEE